MYIPPRKCYNNNYLIKFIKRFITEDENQHIMQYRILNIKWTVMIICQVYTCIQHDLTFICKIYVHFNTQLNDHEEYEIEWSLIYYYIVFIYLGIDHDEVEECLVFKKELPILMRNLWKKKTLKVKHFLLLRRFNGWMDGWMDVSMGGWICAWMDKCVEHRDVQYV